MIKHIQVCLLFAMAVSCCLSPVVQAYREGAHQIPQPPGREQNSHWQEALAIAMAIESPNSNQSVFLSVFFYIYPIWLFALDPDRFCAPDRIAEMSNS